MKIIGWVVLILGVMWTITALNTDVSVTTEYGGRVNNIGLIASRENHVIVSVFIALFGLLMIIFSKKTHSITNLQVKCPFCAEFINPDAVKCKHCGSDVSEKRNNVLARRPKVFTGEDMFTRDSTGCEILDFEGIKAMAKQLDHEMPKNSALSIMVTHAPVINKVSEGLPDGLRKSFKIELEEILKIIKQK